MIEAARLTDVAALAELEAVALGEDAWSAGLIEQGVLGNLPTVHYLVVRRDGAVVAYAVTSVAGDVAELQRIAVEPGSRRGGLASALLEEVARLARAEGATRVLLEVREDNAGAIAFYGARGFATIDRRPRYYRDGAAAAVMLRALTGPDVNEWTTA